MTTFMSEDASEHEVLWNSRDGVVPASIKSATTGELLVRVFPLVDGELCNPDYVPAVGERVFVDLTEQRARVFAARRLEHAEQLEPTKLCSAFGSREEALQVFFDQMMSCDPALPDILVVTAGYIDELLERRKGSAEDEGFESVRAFGAEPFETYLYDKQLRPLTNKEFWALKAQKSYWQVAYDEIDENTYVSTVWIGINRSVHEPGPIIFETIVFRRGTAIAQHAWSTEAEALDGHAMAMTAATQTATELNAKKN